MIKFLKHRLVKFLEKVPYIQIFIYNNLYLFKFLFPHDKDYYALKLIFSKSERRIFLDVGGNIVTVGDITTQGNIVAKTFIVSSSVSHFTQSFSSGSTIFGDDSGDTHEVTGSLLVTGSLNVEKGRIFEQGTSVIDHATAMAIVFGG